nr:hypothetical protein [Tanacetum cinerariifolium]
MGIRIPPSNVPSSAADEAITNEMHDGLGKATTTAFSLATEQGSEKKLKHERRWAVINSSKEEEEARLDYEDSPKHGRMIEEIDKHENVNLVKSNEQREEERESLSIKERSRLLAEFINKRKKMMAAKRAKEKRNKPPTQAQQRTYISNYLKNIGGYTLKQLKQYSFAKIKMLFDNTMKSIRRFVLMESEGQVREGSLKEGESLKRSAEEELRQEQKVKEDIAQQEDVVAKQAEKESSKKAGGRLKRKTLKAKEDKDKRQKKQDDPEKLTLILWKGFSGKVTPLFQITIQQFSEDEAVHKQLGDRLVRAATTASSLEVEQDSGNITKTQSKATPNEPSSQRTDSGGSLRCQESMEDTITQTRRVKKLEKRNRLRTHKLKRLYKVSLSARVESSSDEECLGEDVSKQGRMIYAIDADEHITFVSVQVDADKEMFHVDDLGGEEMFVAGQNKIFVEEVVDAAQVSTAATTITITIEEITLAQALKALKTSKPKDKDKGIMIEEPVKPKKKDQIRLNEEATKKLQAEFDEEEILAREKAKKEERSNIALIKTWDDIQEKINVDHQLAERVTLEQSWWKAKKREQEQEITKKQKVEDDKEKAELKQLMETIPYKEVTIDDIPLGVKSPRIVDWKFHKERKEKLLLNNLYKLVKARYGSTRPVESMDYLLWSEMKIMFEPHVEDDVWKMQQGYKVLEWKLYDSCRVHSLMM